MCLPCSSALTWGAGPASLPLPVICKLRWEPKWGFKWTHYRLWLTFSHYVLLRSPLPPRPCGRPIMLYLIPWPLERSRRWIHYMLLLNVNNRSLTSTSEHDAPWCTPICCRMSPLVAFLEIILMPLLLQICGTYQHLQGQRRACG